MLHGRSRPQGSDLKIHGLRKNEADHPTYFGHFSSVKIFDFNFTPETTALRPDDPDWTERAAIVQNNHKPRITPDENKALLRWLDAKRERQPWWRRTK